MPSIISNSSTETTSKSASSFNREEVTIINAGRSENRDPENLFRAREVNLSGVANLYEVKQQEPGTVAPLLQSEPARLEALHRYGIGEDQEELFNTFTRMAAQLTASPVALLSFIDADRVIHRAKVGVLPDLIEREGAFWYWAVLQTELFVVPDATLDERFKSSPIVSPSHGIRFFAGAPLVTADGYVIGTLAVLDWRPRELHLSQSEALLALASSVMAHLDLAQKNADSKRPGPTQEEKPLQNQAENQNEGSGNTLEPRLAAFKKKYEILAKKEEQYALILNSMNDGLWDWDLRTNRIEYSNRWKALLDYKESEISTRPDEWFSRVHPSDKEVVESDVMSHLLGLTPRFYSEHRICNANGEYRWVLCRGMAARNRNKEVYRFSGSMADITERKFIEQQLFHDASHDSLTGLPNRTLFMDKLQRLLDNPLQREDYLFAVLFLDLDRFKYVNDSLGHQMGDRLLIEMARRLESSTRPGDLIARLGGDEFAVLLERIKQIDDAIQAAQRIQQELALPFNLDGHEVFVSASIGISHNLVPCNSAEDFIRNADTAMYRAKDNRRGSFELFDKGMHEQAVARLHLETDLRHALAHDEFEVHYQPIVSLDNWKIRGFEALVRWQHREKGMIPPARFIPVAEETGMIIQIGELVLRAACEQTRYWQDKFPSIPPMFISVNLSCKQFADVNLVNKIKAILEETGVDAGSLKIEITESAIIENIEAATTVLNQLKEIGVNISLDDFGTGYSSLSYLHRFPIDTLKIDQSFVTRMSLPKNAEIVSTILSLATTLGMDVIAEGVETQEQILQLTGMRCNYVQGFLLSKPLNGEAMTHLIEETYMSGIGGGSV